MPEKSDFQTGEPCWIDLATPDIAAANAFYAGLFGWEADAPVAEAGGYTIYRLGGKQVAAAMPAGEGQPTSWSTYIRVDDVDKTAELVTGAGGTLAMPPMDVMEEGRMAVFQDPTGAFLGVWQPRNMHGAQLVDEPGTFTWAELTSRDVAAAKAFYPAVFGWGEETHEGGPMPYTEFKIGDRSVAGLMPTPPGVPAEMPSYWMPYFASTDVEATAAKATGLGARVVMPKTEIPQGSFAILHDPTGAIFGLYHSQH